MTNIVPVDRQRHAGKGWRHLTGYGFVARDSVVPLGGSEFPQAISAMPIAFMERSAGHYIPVGLMAVSKGNNVFVGPAGQWHGNYLPAVLRVYPFSLSRVGGSEEAKLCIDEDSGLVVDDNGGEGVEKFFEQDGSPSASTTALTEALRRLEHDQTITDRAVTVLADAGVIKPWPLSVMVGNEQVTVSGLYRVDEPTLNALDDQTFLKLRKTSALVIAHGQLMSMAQVNLLARLSSLKQRMTAGPSDLLPV